MFRNARIPMQNLRDSAVTSKQNGATTSTHSLPDSALTTVTQKLKDEKLMKIRDWMASLDWSVGMLQPHIPDTPFLPVMAQRLADLITDVNTLLLQRQISLPLQSLTVVMTIIGLGGQEGVWMLKLLAQMVAANQVDGTPPAASWNVADSLLVTGDAFNEISLIMVFAVAVGFPVYGGANIAMLHKHKLRFSVKR